MNVGVAAVGEIMLATRACGVQHHGDPMEYGGFRVAALKVSYISTVPHSLAR